MGTPKHTYDHEAFQTFQTEASFSMQHLLTVWNLPCRMTKWDAIEVDGAFSLCSFFEMPPPRSFMEFTRLKTTSFACRVVVLPKVGSTFEGAMDCELMSAS